MEQLRELLGTLEANLRPEWLSTAFKCTPPLVRHAFNAVGREVAAVPPAGSNDDMSLREADQHPGALPSAAVRSLVVGLPPPSRMLLGVEDGASDRVDVAIRSLRCAASSCRACRDKR